MHQFAGQSPDDKIKFLFKVYDIDGKQKKITFYLVENQVIEWCWVTFYLNLKSSP